MKKVFLFMLLGAVMPLQIRAQVNPKPGIIITNHGDTIRGNIDFRTNERMITGPVLVIIFIIFLSKYFVLRKNIYTFAIKLINHP